MQNVINIMFLMDLNENMVRPFYLWHFFKILEYDDDINVWRLLLHFLPWHDIFVFAWPAAALT